MTATSSTSSTTELIGDAQRPTTAAPAVGASSLGAFAVSAWFSDHKVLEGLTLDMRAAEVTALIGPSGCGKSTFIRILNRMHELVPGAALSGRVELDGVDIYGGEQRPIDTRRHIGMVFQKPNPFPAMSVYNNVLSGLRLSGSRIVDAEHIVEESLTRAGLWKEVRNRLSAPGGSLSGGQQQRLCIARALAVRPKVLLMDEPCSALDPSSTARIEDTIAEIVHDVTVVIVTHNMQQAQRVSHRCAFFMVEEGSPGGIVEVGPTEKIFNSPDDQRTADYVHGRFG
jgi:phosphate transport system ATP-binding protein